MHGARLRPHVEPMKRESGERQVDNRPGRFDNFLKFLGGLTLLIASIFLIARCGAYLEGRPFWPFMNNQTANRIIGPTPAPLPAAGFGWFSARIG